MSRTRLDPEFTIDRPPRPSRKHARNAAPVRIRWPARQSLPVVVASPHSGRIYSRTFLAQTALPRRRLRSSEDCFVDEIFATTPDLGAPLLLALFPRVFIDVNRDPYELDPAMYDGPLPSYVTTRNARIAAGLGTIARVVSDSEPIYHDKLSFADVEERVTTCYSPYHQALSALIEETRARFGYCVLLDCHSMPSEAAMQHDRATDRTHMLDIVLGDCHATACHPAITAEAETRLTAMGYSVQRNKPYAGGFVTRHYGRPEEKVHALQIELNRGLYMDETRIRRRRACIADLAGNMTELIRAIGTLEIPDVPQLAVAAE